MAGPVLFARYAYAPNERGFCGPPDHRAMLEYGAEQVSDGGLIELASAFTGPWPYLTLIAGSAGISDPFDARVVEAYWIGNELLDGVDMTAFGNGMLARFRKVAGPSWNHLAEAIPAGAVAHHSFHVLGVYPWVGLLGPERGGEPLRILDRCRIRWGRVEAVVGDEVTVTSQSLTWNGVRLGIGEPQPETARRAIGGVGFVPDLVAGDWVALHWDWVCDRISPRQLRHLRRYTALQLDITNHRVSHSGPGMAMA
ncbi:MAG: DUF6390 family protein [Actinomycetota bacterium]|nr:DUF6390 family protein [Actinomycetota bacterium]